MPSVNNQIGYPISGTYAGTIITKPAKLPDPVPPTQPEPNIVKPTLDETGTANTPSGTPIKTNLGFGYIEVEGQPTVAANRYMSTVNFVEGNNIVITTNAITSTVTFSSVGDGTGTVTSVGLSAGNGISVSGGPITSSGNITVTNTGVLSASAGNGITVDTANGVVTVTNTGVLSVSAGNSINVATANGVVTVTNTFTENVYSGGNASGTLTPNRNNGTIQKFTLIGNITLAPPTNMAAGQSLTLIFTQDGTGNRLLDANTAYLFASGFQTLSTASGAIDMLNIFSDGDTYYTTLTVEYS